MTHKYAHITTASVIPLWKQTGAMEYSSGYDLDTGMTKEAYLEWVHKWKEDYKALTQLIHSLKAERKSAFQEKHKKILAATYNDRYLGSCLHDLKKIATNLLTKRAEYKIITGIKREENLCPA